MSTLKWEGANSAKPSSSAPEMFSTAADKQQALGGTGKTTGINNETSKNDTGEAVGLPQAAPTNTITPLQQKQQRVKTAAGIIITLALGLFLGYGMAGYTGKIRIYENHYRESHRKDPAWHTAPIHGQDDYNSAAEGTLHSMTNQRVPLEALYSLPLNMINRMESLLLQWGAPGTGDMKQYLFNVESAYREEASGMTKLYLSSGYTCVVYKDYLVLYNSSDKKVGTIPFNIPTPASTVPQSNTPSTKDDNSQNTIENDHQPSWATSNFIPENMSNRDTGSTFEKKYNYPDSTLTAGSGVKAAGADIDDKDAAKKNQFIPYVQEQLKQNIDDIPTPSTSFDDSSDATSSNPRRLGKKLGKFLNNLNENGRYPTNAAPKEPNSFFDAYCRYGCGGMAVTFPYYYRPFFGYGYPLVGTEANFPQGYGGYPAAETLALQGRAQAQSPMTIGGGSAVVGGPVASPFAGAGFPGGVATPAANVMPGVGFQ